MENKQTAVEWLANQIAEIPNTYLTKKYGWIELSGVKDDKIYRINMDIIHLIEEAKQMEKDRLTLAKKESYNEGWLEATQYIFKKYKQQADGKI